MSERPGTFSYITTDIPPGMTITEYRRSRKVRRTRLQKLFGLPPKQ
jgi:hypothetical protein